MPEIVSSTLVGELYGITHTPRYSYLFPSLGLLEDKILGLDPWLPSAAKSRMTALETQPAVAFMVETLSRRFPIRCVHVRQSLRDPGVNWMQLVFIGLEHQSLLENLMQASIPRSTLLDSPKWDADD